MNAIQSYLRGGGTIAELEEKYALKIKRHPKYNNLCLFKYDQINSRPENHPIIVCARGLILDEADNYAIVSWPFDRFFNHGQDENPVEIDWNTANVSVKLDGSLLILTNYQGEWFAHTTGSAAAEGNVNGFDFSFAELFDRIFRDMGLELPQNTDLCFMFEVTSQFNRIVVNYKEPTLTLIGVRNKKTGEELPLDLFPQYPTVKTYALNSFDDIIASLKDIPPTSMEGYVVRSNLRDGNGGYKRLKLKSVQYVALHHIKDSWSARRVVEIVRNGEISEITLYFPEFAAQLNETKERYEQLVADLTSTYNELKTIPIQKDFALQVQARKCPIPGALFAMRAKKTPSIKAFIAEMNIANLMRVLGLKDEVEDTLAKEAV